MVDEYVAITSTEPDVGRDSCDVGVVHEEETSLVVELLAEELHLAEGGGSLELVVSPDLGLLELEVVVLEHQFLVLGQDAACSSGEAEHDGVSLALFGKDTAVVNQHVVDLVDDGDLVNANELNGFALLCDNELDLYACELLTHLDEELLVFVHEFLVIVDHEKLEVGVAEAEGDDCGNDDSALAVASRHGPHLSGVRDCLVEHRLGNRHRHCELHVIDAVLGELHINPHCFGASEQIFAFQVAANLEIVVFPVVDFAEDFLLVDDCFRSHDHLLSGNLRS